MAEQPIFPEQSAEVTQAMEEENAYALNYDSLTQKERAAAPDAFLLSLDEAKLLHKAAGAYADVLTKYIRLTDEEIYTPEMQARLLDESKAAIEGAGINKTALIDICRKLETGHYWTYEIVSIDFSDDSYIYEATTGRDEKPRTITKESVPEFYGDNKTIADKAAALSIPPDALFITPLDRSQIKAISTIYSGETISPTQHSGIGIGKYSPMPSTQNVSMMAAFVNNPARTSFSITGEPTREQIVNNGQTRFRFCDKSNGNTVSMEFDDLPSFLGGEIGETRHGTGIEDIKTFFYVMQNIMIQESWKRQDKTVTINLDDMVKHDFGTRTNIAYKKLVQMKEKYKDIKFSFKASESKKGTMTGEGYLFSGDIAKHPGGHFAEITLGQRFPVYLFVDYVRFPAWGYNLKGKAYMTCVYVFLHMRKNAAATAKNKCTIKIDTLREHLGIKAPEDLKSKGGARKGKNSGKGKELISRPITEAIKAINEQAAQDKTIDGKFCINIRANENGSVNDFLRGTLEIEATGEYTDYLTPIVNKHETFLDEVKKQKERNVKKNAKAAANAANRGQK